MATEVIKLLKRVTRATGLEERLRNARTSSAGLVRVDGQGIPPARIRLGGHNFEDDQDFLAGALADAERLEKELGVRAGSRVLDIGCGVGRLPIGLRAHFGLLSNYTGVDVDHGRIKWCRKHITGSNVEFVFVDVANERYNPAGEPISEEFRLPLDDASFDAIYLYSVFSHMETPDVVAYLHEFRRLLAQGAMVFLTAFVEDNVEDMSVNPHGYGDFPGEWKGALHCVRYDRSFFEGLVRDAGLEIERVTHRSDTDGQSAVFIRRTA